MTARDKNYLQAMRDTSLLFGMNDVYIEGLYEDYLANPASVPELWRAYFDTQQPAGMQAHDIAHSPIQRAFASLPKQAAGTGIFEAGLERKQVAVLQLINAHRFLGVRIANLDPLGRHAKPEVPELDPAYYGLGEADMDLTFETGSLVGASRMTLRNILQLLRQTYCGKIGAEYMYLSDIGQKRWFQQRLEGVRGVPDHSQAQKRRILERLTAAETLERYLHTKYVGQKRFSLEGGETLIPLLDHLLQRAGSQGVRETVIGMAHR